MAPRKPAELRQGRQSAPVKLARIETNVVQAPEPPPDLLPTVERAWTTFWSSQLADFIHVTDLPALERLFVNYDELARSRAALFKTPPPKPIRALGESHNEFQMRLGVWKAAVQSVGRLVPSEKGLRLNPLLVHMRTLEKNIVALEDRFGFTLRARQELGLNRIRARTLSEQNAAQEAHHGNGDKDTQDGEDDDPRAALYLADPNG